MAKTKTVFCVVSASVLASPSSVIDMSGSSTVAATRIFSTASPKTTPSLRFGRDADRSLTVLAPERRRNGDLLDGHE